jgi:hypothetical protein
MAEETEENGEQSGPNERQSAVGFKQIKEPKLIMPTRHQSTYAYLE